MQNMTSQSAEPLRVGVRKAAEMLGISEAALRQKMPRHTNILPPDRSSGVTSFNVNDVLAFYARRKKLPALSEHPEANDAVLVNIFEIVPLVHALPVEILRHVRAGEIKGYVTQDGRILIDRASAIKFATGEADHGTSDF